MGVAAWADPSTANRARHKKARTKAVPDLRFMVSPYFFVRNSALLKDMVKASIKPIHFRISQFPNSVNPFLQKNYDLFFS
jgi:hypothetical protein